ncbi:MAG: isoquinoline 1-oxidoreductase [Gammaproteobacteria bacterium]|nr:isoquinoline 1-oxidoreductase [Gammaproteobacteria bacterium]
MIAAGQKKITNSSGFQFSRRRFLKLSGLFGGGLAIGAFMPVGFAESPTLVGSAQLNAYVQINDDGSILIYSGSPEMGQGIKTSLPMIVAEEMGADWLDVRVKQTPEVDTEKFGGQSTGGSYTLYRNWDLMREMGATAREMLISAAAEAMELPANELRAKNSRVTHISTRRFRTFQQLASLASRQPVPKKESLVFKKREDYTILGTSKSQADSLEIVTGVGDFGIDTRVEGMQYGYVAKCPRVGGTIVSADLDKVRRQPGVSGAWILKAKPGVGGSADGIGLVGSSTWAVMKAAEKVDAVWDYSDASSDSWTEFVSFSEKIENTGSEVKVERGGVDRVFADDQNTVVSSFFEYPYISHLCLEPMNCTAYFRPSQKNSPEHLEVWLPTQNAPRFQKMAQEVYGLGKNQLTIHVKRMGGSFGRRTSNEYVTEAIELSRLSGTPVKVTWSREDSVRGDFFREGGFNRIRGALDSKGRLVGWEEHTVGVAPNGKRPWFSGPNPRAFPISTVTNARASLTSYRMDTPVGPWRAPYSNVHAFSSQCFIHELATAAKRDHFDFLVEMLGTPRWLKENDIRALNTERALGVVQMAAEKGGWGREMRSGSGLGLAFYFCHAAHVAELAEVSVNEFNQVTLHKVTAAVDVGPIINMSGAISQIQGAIIDGYSAMMGQKITMENGVIQQTNLHQYPVLRIDAAPEVDVHFIESDHVPTGLGEPGLPPLAPAVANAIYSATGKRVRKMPLSDLGFSV